MYQIKSKFNVLDHHAIARMRYYRSYLKHFNGTDFDWNHLTGYETIYQIANEALSQVNSDCFQHETDNLQKTSVQLSPSDEAISNILQSQKAIHSRHAKLRVLPFFRFKEFYFEDFETFGNK